MIRKKINLLSITLGLSLVFTIALTNLTFASANTKRLAGLDRYTTSVAISQNGWTQSDYAILATGENFPDALGSAPLSKKYNAPILLTNKDTLNDSTNTELKRLGVKNVFILGGTGVISQNVGSQLNSMAVKTTRLFGQDRYETSVAIANQIVGEKELIVTTGEDFADALSISSIAGIKNIPIILVPKNNLPNSVKAFISNHPVDKTYIIGDSNIISDTVANEFSNVERITGTTKYDRNQNIINRFKSDLSFNNIYSATGENFADALSGVALAIKNNSPIVLISNSNNNGANALLKDKNVGNNMILGGEGAVSTTNIDQVTGSTTDTTTIGFLPRLSDVPVVPNVNYYKSDYDNVIKEADYYYSASQIPSDFFITYPALLLKNGWEYKNSDMDAMGRPKYRYIKGNNILMIQHLIGETNIDDIVISCNIH